MDGITGFFLESWRQYSGSLSHFLIFLENIRARILVMILLLLKSKMPIGG